MRKRKSEGSLVRAIAFEIRGRAAWDAVLEVLDDRVLNGSGEVTPRRGLLDVGSGDVVAAAATGDWLGEGEGEEEGGDEGDEVHCACGIESWIV